VDQQSKGQVHSLLGHDMLRLVDTSIAWGSAYRVALRALTHDGRWPVDDAIGSLDFFSLEAFRELERDTSLAITCECPIKPDMALTLYFNSLGRLYIRRGSDPEPDGTLGFQMVRVGHVAVTAEVMQAVRVRSAEAEASELQELTQIRREIDELHLAGELPKVLEQVIDHVEHVESVCFYVKDKFFGVVDRFTNLTDTKSSKGVLSVLRTQDCSSWTDEQILLVAALHALFLSGRAIRFEEFNGMILTATALWRKLNALKKMYETAHCGLDPAGVRSFFETARQVGRLAEQATGKNWLRYRWIYGLTFYKTEKILQSAQSSEDPHLHLKEFGGDHSILTGCDERSLSTERDCFFALARVCLARDRRGDKCPYLSRASSGWVEYLIERIVASAVVATRADYGMSSSIRSIAQLVQPDEFQLLQVIHALTPKDFYTCFVSQGFDGLEPAIAKEIATSVQKRMMFNRWHFVPGNFPRDKIQKSRHWYYPPAVPDIAIHSDVHRAGHSRAYVKFSVRAPGPDMSRSPLSINNRQYRGFYDVRVVRMDGDSFTTEDMLRTRRRTLWLEAVYAAIVDDIEKNMSSPWSVRGFQIGDYMDLNPSQVAAYARPPR